MNGRAYYNNVFGDPFAFVRGSCKLQPSHVSGSYPYLNCANGRMTPVNVTYDQEIHILEACPTPVKVFRLNPDAKSFVPTHCLNPYAREFKPKCFQEENLRHKRSCSSNQSSEDEASSGDDSILPPVHSNLKEPVIQDGPSSSSSTRSPSTTSIGGGKVVVVDSPLKKKECYSSSNERKEICDRLKICSLSSDESGKDDEEESKSDLEDSSSELGEEDEDEEDDWDDLEFGSPQSPSVWGDLPDEFKDNFGLTCPLTQSLPSSNSNNNNNNNTSRVSEFLLSVDSDDEESDEEENEEDILREKELQERLAAINKEWSKHYLKLPNHNVTTNGGVMKKNVSFSSENCWTVIEEDPELAQELRESRTSDHLARKADRDRIEKIISPILDQDHRIKVYQRLYNNSEAL